MATGRCKIYGYSAGAVEHSPYARRFGHLATQVLFRFGERPNLGMFTLQFFMTVRASARQHELQF